jgi:hypothetical protein
MTRSPAFRKLSLLDGIVIGLALALLLNAPSVLAVWR